MRRPILIVSAFFGAFQWALLMLLVSPYLAQFLTTEEVGLAFALGAGITMLAFLFAPHALSYIAPRRLIIALAALQCALVFVLSTTPSFKTAVSLILIQSTVSYIITYLQDLILEASATEKESGRLRALYFTAINTAVIIAPYTMGTLLGDTNEYWRAFLASSLVLLPYIALMNFVGQLKHTPITGISIRATLRCLFHDRDLRSVCAANLVLQTFYNSAIFLVPLYLHTELGIPWSTLGWIFSAMYIPFVLLEYPAGYLADRKWGDKEMMIGGFLIIGGSFALVGMISASTAPLTILSIMLLLYAGSAIAEAMIEGHFFRRISGTDAASVSIYRMMGPAGRIVGPLACGVLLSAVGWTPLFFITGLGFALIGAGASFGTRDSR